jgi:hypothetical protein
MGLRLVALTIHHWLGKRWVFKLYCLQKIAWKLSNSNHTVNFMAYFSEILRHFLVLENWRFLQNWRPQKDPVIQFFEHNYMINNNLTDTPEKISSKMWALIYCTKGCFWRIKIQLSQNPDVLRKIQVRSRDHQLKIY